MKNTYTDAILLRKAELEKDIQIAERFLETAPKGRLRTSETYGIPQFYYVSEETGSKGRYMRKKESALIHNLAQKEYSVKLVRESLLTVKAFAPVILTTNVNKIVSNKPIFLFFILSLLSYNNIITPFLFFFFF